MIWLFSPFLQLIARIAEIRDLDFFCNSVSDGGEAPPCIFPCGRILIKTLMASRDSATAENKAKIDR